VGISKITRNFQATIPKDVRNVKRLKEGDRVLFAIDGDRVELVKLDEDVVRSAAGLWAGLKETGAEYQRRIRRGWGRRRNRSVG
jgi:AbrB family looped-hinge helix DNA binding protein